MNYQKLFSRFYSVADQSGVEIIQKYTNMTANISSSPSNVEGRSDSVHYEYISASVEEEDQVLYVDTRTNETETSWTPLSPEPTATVVEPLSIEEVRWFYKSTEDKTWNEFNGYDSILIESKYRELLPLVAAAEGGAAEEPSMEEDQPEDRHTPHGEGKEDNQHMGKESPQLDIKPLPPSGELFPFSKSFFTSQDSTVEDSEQSQEEEDLSPKANRIVVRGGMYEADLSNMTCSSIYWPGEHGVITRGLYFYDGSWQPLEGGHGEVLEAEHLRLFSVRPPSSEEEEGFAPGSALHLHHFPQFHVEWLSARELYLYWGGAPQKLVRSVTQKLGFYQSTGYRLRRGYKTRASISEKPPDITHVVFVIHGIGQKMDAGRIIRNTNALRASFDWLRVHYPCTSAGPQAGRAELFPARWRAGARGSAARLLTAAAPPAAPALRRAINEAAMDVMYYTSPQYGKQVQDDLRQELTRLHTMFMARNPQYAGKFSAVAHSLGCVILHDLVVGHQPGCDRCSQQDRPGCGIGFPLERLFCLGSPLSVFLALRHPAPPAPSPCLPRLYNIFHPSDPVAYRMEPLVFPEHEQRPPEVVPPYHQPPPTPTHQTKIFFFILSLLHFVSSSVPCVLGRVMRSCAMTLSVSRAFVLLTMARWPPCLRYCGLKLKWAPAKGQPLHISPWRIWSYVKTPWQKGESGSPIPAAAQTQTKDKQNGAPAPATVIIQSSPQAEQAFDLASETCDENASHSTEYSPSGQANLSPNDVYYDSVDDRLVNDDSKDVIQDVGLSVGGEEERGQQALPYRIDYCLRDNGITNNYISAITSHTSYWHNYDVAYFILTHLFSDVAETTRDDNAPQ